MNTIINELKNNSQFKRFMVPIDESADFRDAVYFLRDDGTFVFTEGYYHRIELPGKRESSIRTSFTSPSIPLNPFRTISGKSFSGGPT